MTEAVRRAIQRSQESVSAIWQQPKDSDQVAYRNSVAGKSTGPRDPKSIT